MEVIETPPLDKQSKVRYFIKVYPAAICTIITSWARDVTEEADLTVTSLEPTVRRRCFI